MTDKQFEECIRQIVSGDRRGLKEIFDEYSKLVYSAALAVVKQAQDAEDVTSDTFLKLWKSASTYKPGTGHKFWLMTIARNTALDYLRKSGREQLIIDDDTDENGSFSEIPDNASTDNEVISDMTFKEMLDTLPASEREIVNMKLGAQMTLREISEVLKKPLGTVSWKYQNAVKKLSKVVKEVRQNV